MPKRFTDSDKWKQPFLRGLKAPYKLLWLYIQDECDHAGIWQVDFEVAQIKIGESLNKKTAVESFEKIMIPIQGGEKWFFPQFIEFQYGDLKQENRAHASVISLLKKYSLWNFDENKPLTSPLQGGKDKDKETVKAKVKEQGVGGTGEGDLTFIQKAGEIWSAHRIENKFLKFDWKPVEMAALKQILTRIEDYMKAGQNDYTPTEPEILTNWEIFLKHRPKWGKWNDEQWELKIINSKFDNIYHNLKSLNNGKFNPEQLKSDIERIANNYAEANKPKK